MESPQTNAEAEHHPDEEDFLPEDGGYEYLRDHLTGNGSNDDDGGFIAQGQLIASHQKDHLPPLLQDENLNEYGRRDDNYYNDDDDMDSLAGVNEADEAVNLADILAARDSSLVEDELWALCRECCLVLEVVNCTPEMFQTLCITPDTVAFDNAGNVCFLDLGSDPESLYLPPEFSDVTNNYKSHLYSLGMTLLYAAEYNVDPSRPEISQELRELFGCMTAEVLTSRPSLEDIITLCEEELVGKSSQEVCVDIAQTFALPTPTPPDLATVSLADVTASLANYLQSQSNLISAPGGEVSGETGVSEVTDTSPGPQEHSTPLHLPVPVQEHTTASPTEEADDGDMPVRGVHTGCPMPTGNRGNKPTPAARKLSRSSQDSSKDTSQQKPPVPKKPDLNKTVKTDQVSEGNGTINTNQSDHQKMLHGNDNNVLLDREGSKFKDSPLSGTGHSSLEARHSSGAVDSQGKRPRKSKGLSLGDILETLERPLVEDEVWAVCREGTIALNKKRKHLPAYISPDTLLLRESGALAFRAIPEEKPLEVIYMAPEIQQKGQLSDKMCLFGLGVTMKFAIGNKYSTESSGVGDDLQKLLANMVEEDPEKRPSIEDVSEACGEHECDLGIPSSSICQALYQEAFEKVADKMAFAMPSDPPNIQDPPESSNGSAFRSIQGGSLIRPAAISSSTAAFKPISNLPEGKGHSGLPSQFMSSATHFKPIILQQSVTPAPEVKDVSKQQESPKDCQPNDKDKEVVKKLKELKKNLMQHRQPGKDKPDAKVARKSSKSPSVSPKVSQVLNKKPSEDQIEVQNKSSSDTKSETGGPLESLLSEIQKQGAVPNTQALASAIANFLQGQMTQSPNSNLNQGQPQVQSQGQSQSQGQIPGQQNSFVTQGQIASPLSNTATPSMTLQQPNINLPGQFHPSLIGQNLSVPIGPQQYSGGLMPGYPLQVQLQQDPRTGFIQLVPTGILPQAMGPHVGEDHTHSGSNCDNHSVHSARSPKQHIYSDNSSADNSAILNSSFNSNRSRGGRTARDLVQKTAGIRSRHSQGKASPLSSQPQGEYLWRSKSAHALDNLDGDQGAEGQASQRRNLSLAPGHVYDDSVLPANRRDPKKNVNSDIYSQSSKSNVPRPRTIVGYPENSLGRGGQYFTQPPRTRSQSSSPSPSKDSGVSGMNTGYKPPPPGSLMERLLSNVNVKQQQKLGQVVHLLREEFAFDGYMENGVEDIAMAEYITSLGNLKLETFASAVTEKYSDLYWGSDLLFNLYDAANGLKGSRRLVKNGAKTYDQNPVTKQENSPAHLPIPGLDHPDQNLSSSSPSESGLPQTPQKVPADSNYYQNVSRQPDKPKSRHVSKSQHHNTSDSSDAEQHDRRRRYRRKQHTDKSRNSQEYNLRTSGYDTPSMELHPLRKDTDISPRLQMHMTNGENPLLQNGNVQVPQIRDWEPEIPKTSHANNPNSLIQDDDKVSDSGSEKPPPPQSRQNAWVVSPDKTDEFASTSMSLDRRRKPTPDSSLSPSTRQVSASNNALSADMSKLKRRVTPEKPPRHSLVHSNRVEGHIQPGPRPLKAIHRDGSTSSHSSEVAEVLPVTNLSRNMSQLSLDNSPIDKRLRNRKGHIVFHSAMMELFSSLELDKFRQEIDEDDPVGLQSRLASIQQQLMMERKMKRKSQTFYSKLAESPNSTKGEQKNRIVQVSKNLEDMTQKVRHLELCRTHIEMLQAELSGIHASYLHSLATCPQGQPLHLRPCQDSSFLQFQHPKEPHSGYEILSLQSGTPEGLMAYLFANTALRDGYTHQFMYCFRYFVKPVKLLSFLVDTFKAAAEASGQSSDNNMSKIKRRVMDLIYYWLEGYYSVDFDRNNEATELLHAFLQLSDTAALPEGKELTELLSNCEEGFNIDLVSAKEEEDIHIYKSNTPRKWGSLKNILGRGKASSPKLMLFHEKRTPVTKLTTDDGFLPAKSPRRVDSFTLLDHPPQTLAEQLTLVAQSIFQLTHPVHYLNSKAQGISVAMTMTGSKTPLMQRLTGQDSDQPLPPSLFVNKTLRESAVQLMIEHDQEVGHWVAAEIVNCSNAKNQLAILTKFLHTAQICKDMRNYGTCLAILDGLENLIVKQLPAWRNLQGKCVSIFEELSSVRLFLKNDGMAITSITNSHLLPTIPSVLLFLFHVQQQEIGSFQLANGMYKWSKIRSISKIIDQIRIFKDHLYGFEPDFDLQDDIQLRIREFGGQDIHQIAAQHHTNYQKMPSGGISGAFRKIKVKLQSK
ncbi:kinase non-catalytic C-lobe domain-containing protein 1-like [Ylistrum balloti]|uniref:kinase non-catalytic C-lobe domain-containing protein 1-like n=1 Tax=Ylistrum balloti TaxID=509963 RepID=UPI0029059E13|nr:kinase non-catalytic C-lobe domain-containing protein 1-like [Ylistrum balloti]